MDVVGTANRPEATDFAASTANLRDHGFAYGSLRGEVTPFRLHEFQGYWDRLPRDPYLPPEFGTRLRRHGRFEFDTAVGKFSPLAAQPYFQSRETNPVMGGMQRSFEPLLPEAATHPVLHAILQHSATVFPLHENARWLVNTHFIRIPTTLGAKGCPCPEGIHNDGFEYISIHLIQRHRIKGALTRLFHNDQRPLATVNLQHPLDALFADDRKVLHYTDDFTPDETADGFRDTLLVSYERR